MDVAEEEEVIENQNEPEAYQEAPILRPKAPPEMEARESDLSPSINYNISIKIRTHTYSPSTNDYPFPHPKKTLPPAPPLRKPQKKVEFTKAKESLSSKKFLLLQEYTVHRKRVEGAVAKVDCWPIKVDLSKVASLKQVEVEQEQLRILERANREMVERIALIFRTHGQVDNHFDVLPLSGHYRTDLEQRRLQSIVRKNMQILDAIRDAKGKYSCKEWHRSWKHNLEAMRFGSNYPLWWEHEKGERQQETKRLLQELEPSVLALSPSTISYYSSDDIRVFLEFEAQVSHYNHKRQPLGRIVLLLRPDVVPLAARNFAALCSREKKGYRGTKLNRIVPSLLLQGGAEVGGKSVDGQSAFGGKSFPDENFRLQHNERGTLSMASFRPNSNNSAFLITLAPLPALNGRHVVLGRVLKGFYVLDRISELGSPSGKPRSDVYISNCGLLEEGEEEEESPVASQLMREDAEKQDERKSERQMKKYPWWKERKDLDLRKHSKEWMCDHSKKLPFGTNKWYAEPACKVMDKGDLPRGAAAKDDTQKKAIKDKDVRFKQLSSTGHKSTCPRQRCSLQKKGSCSCCKLHVCKLQRIKEKQERMKKIKCKLKEDSKNMEAESDK